MNFFEEFEEFAIKKEGLLNDTYNFKKEMPMTSFLLKVLLNGLFALKFKILKNVKLIF